ncbi:MAG: peroxiredoxin [Clostridia bacterium]|nr:peroxiredoxin [Clostridia bacterium]
MHKIGKKAPPFYAESTRGEIYFPSSHSGRWVVLYYYGDDFSPAAALDITELNKKVPKFSAYNASIVGISSDSRAAHIAWALELRNMDKDGKVIDIELVSDKNAQIAKAYGIEDEKAVMIIDPDGVLRSFHRYEQGTGLNVTEIEREVLALTAQREHGSITPAGWTPGEQLVAAPPTTLADAQAAVSQREAQGLICIDWYICYDTGM